MMTVEPCCKMHFIVVLCEPRCVTRGCSCILITRMLVNLRGEARSASESTVKTRQRLLLIFHLAHRQIVKNLKKNSMKSCLKLQIVTFFFV